MPTTLAPTVSTGSTMALRNIEEQKNETKNPLGKKIEVIQLGLI
jgi:hypothetical protein